MKCVGLDIATCTGMAVVGDDDEGRGKTIHLAPTVGFKRLQLIAAEVERTLETWQPAFAVVEGYAFARNVNSFIVLVGIGTMVRSALQQQKIPWLEVPPTVLKKWTTGKGNAKKEDMAAAVFKTWGYKSDSDDIIDAYALARMGYELGYATLLAQKGVTEGHV